MQLYRLGGDEFILLVPAEGRPDETEAAARAMIDLLATPLEIGGQLIQIGTSVGIAIAPDAGSNIDELLTSADIALYVAKAAGRGRHALYDPAMRIEDRGESHHEARRKNRR